MVSKLAECGMVAKVVRLLLTAPARTYSCCSSTFSQSELDFYYGMFNKYDVDKDGLLNRLELNELYRKQLGRKLNVRDLEKMICAMGVSPSEKAVSFCQYVNHLHKRFGPYYCKEELLKYFDDWDKNNDGRLDWLELRQAVTYMGYDPDHPELYARFKVLDCDCDNALEFAEFAELANDGLRKLTRRA